MVFGDNRRVGPCLGSLLLDEGKDGLTEDLVGTNEVDDNGNVGNVKEPKGVVEAKTS